MKLVEIPPGPPVLSTLVAEIYGPDYNEQLKIGRQMKQLLHETNDVVDIDWFAEDDQSEYHFVVDKDKAMRYGVATAQIVANMNAALSGDVAGTLHKPLSFSPVNIKLQLNNADKSGIEELKNLKVIGQQGNAIAIGDMVKITKTTKRKKHLQEKSKECSICDWLIWRGNWKVPFMLFRKFQIV